jgi:ubiquinone/menaquinone biosynthesis C-methylase UbiE
MHFSGSIAEVYDRYFVPLNFEPYAIDLVQRVSALPMTNLLELAAGTGVVTRRLAMSLPSSVFIIATDLSQEMLDVGAAVGTSRPVEWRQADALDLPFDKASFDVVVCQFGVMFLPDKVRAFSEARRVLRRGGMFVFNVWDSLERNEFAAIVNRTMAGLFPADPPDFFARVPHAYHDAATIRRHLAAGGFSSDPLIETVSARSQAASARIAAIGFCQGTPLRSEIEARGATRLAASTDATEAALAARFGDSAIDGEIQALVVTVAA